jgi:glycogen(starch) synthase
MQSKENINRTVLMTADTVGGVWTYCMDLIRSMADSNAYFHLVTAGAPLSCSQKEEISALSNVTVHETDSKLEWMQNPWHDIDLLGRSLVELERKIKPDLVHLNSYSHASLPFRAPVIVGAHSDVFSWWFSVHKCLPGNEWKEYFTRVKDGLRHADVVVTPSRSMLSTLSAIYGTPRDGRVIYNGRNTSLLKPGEKKPLVMCAGRFWDEGKNLAVLMKAAPLINATVIIAGDTGSKSGAEFLPDNLVFRGRLDNNEMAISLAQTLVYVAPAKYEPFGLAILEAAICGCALVLGNIPTLKEIWQNCAVYVDTDDVEKLAAACNHLLRNPELASDYGQKAQQRAKMFTLEKMAAQYQRLYDEHAGADRIVKQQAKTVI